MFLIIIIFSFIIATIKDRKIFAPSIVFTVFWGFICVLAKLQLFDFYETSEEVFMITAIGVLSFNLGCLACIKSKRIDISNNQINNNFSNFLFWISLIGFLPPLTVAIGFIISGMNLHTLRYVAFNRLFQNYFIAVMYMFVAQPTLYFYILLFGSRLFLTPSKKLLIKTAILILCGFLTTANQRLLCYLLSITFFAYIICKKNIKITNTKKLLLILLGTFAVAGLLIIRLNRDSDISLAKTSYIYFTGCMVFLSNYINNFEPDYSIFTSSLLGLIRPIYNVLKKFGIKSNLFELGNEYQYRLQDTSYYVAPTTQYNYFTTLFGNFYNDLGYLGVFIGCFIYGYLCNLAYKNYNNKKDWFTLGILVYVLATIPLGIMSFPFIRTEIAYGLILFILIRKKSNLYG